MNESDSDDSDIFELKRIKPVTKLTKEQAIEIKNEVLAKEDKFEHEYEFDMDKNNSTGKRDDTMFVNCNTDLDDDIFVICGEKSKSSLQLKIDCDHKLLLDKEKHIHPNNVTPIKAKMINNFSPSKLITDYFKSSNDAGEDSSQNENSSAKSADIFSIKENFQLFPIKGKKKLKVDKTSPVKTLLSNPDERITTKSAEELSTPFCTENKNLLVKLKKEFSKKFLDDCLPDASKPANFDIEVPKANENSYYCCVNLKRIIQQELKKQLLLETDAVKEGKAFNRLFLTEEYDSFQKFFNLSDKAAKLFARMLCRKKSWHRISNISYNDISGDIEEVFKILHKEGFVNFNIENEDLDVMLQLLNKPEIQILCKIFNVQVSNGSTKKQDFINAIIENSKSQKGLFEFWGNKGESSRLMLLKKEIAQTLGPCVKLNNLVLSAFNHLLLLFSLAHNIPDEDKWSIQIRILSEVWSKNICFVNYLVHPTVIFQVREDFISYENAMFLMWDFELAVADKNYKKFLSLGQKAKRKFQEALQNEGFKQRFSELPTFLRKFNAGSVYARILTIFCEVYKTKTNPEEIIETMNMLINQHLFLISKKGRWYNILARAYEEMRKPEEAANVLLRALRDESINEVERLTLQLRGLSILNRKKKLNLGLDLTVELRNLCANDIKKPAKVEINARVLGGNVPGFKSVYIQESKSGKIYSSVEEQAISYYKSNGYTEGIHAEGFIIQTIYFLLFFDIIYGISPAGVFQSPYQDAPLDFMSSSFYNNRKEIIDLRLKEMKNWTIEHVEGIIKNVYTNNYGVCSVIDWKYNFTPELFIEIIKCIGVPVLTSIFTRFVHNFRAVRAGFPDLTVWNSARGKCKFVEVKSPNDKLSPAQTIWLDFLRKIGIDCEVCNIKNVARKRFCLD